jgi:hypothetical protein
MNHQLRAATESEHIAPVDVGDNHAELDGTSGGPDLGMGVNDKSLPRIMGRKNFNAFIHEVYGCIDQRLINPARSFSHADMDAEVFDSPVGSILVCHLHEFDAVVVSAPPDAFKQASRAGLSYRFIEVTPARKLRVRTQSGS